MIQKLKKIVLPVLCLLVLQQAQAQNGHRVQVNIRSFANQFIYLGYHYGNSKPISDSVKLDKNGTGVFAGKEKLKPGIYLLGYPDKKQYIELLIEKNQQFSVTADTSNVISSMKLVNSPEGAVFQSYQKFMEQKAKEVMALDAQSKTADATAQEQIRMQRKKNKRRCNRLPRWLEKEIPRFIDIRRF